MTDASLPAGRFAEGQFRVGYVFSRACRVFGRNFLTFTIITGIATLPNLLLQQRPNPVVPFANPRLAMLGIFLIVVLYLLSQGIVLNAALQSINGKPIRLAQSLGVGLRRFFPILGLAIIAGLVMVAYLVGIIAALAGLSNVVRSPGFVALLSLLSMIPAVVLYLMWFVATPACVLEQLGPFRSLARSRALTKGHRGKLFGLALLVVLPGLIVGGVVALVVIAFSYAAAPGLAAPIARIVGLLWNAIWMAFYAILGVVAYHDLRIAKEGIGAEQIATVFE